MRNLNQMNVIIPKYLKYCLFVFLISFSSITGFATNNSNITEIETSFTKNPPTVVLANPSQKKMTTLKKRETVKAYVRNIRKKRRVVVRVNGKRTRKFKFRKHNGLIKIKAKLDQGENLIEIVAKNRKGEASETLLITREQLAGDPSIEIIKPSDVIGTKTSNVYIVSRTTDIKTAKVRTTQNTVLVTAQLQNVEHHDDIVVLVDGLEREFSYHVSSGMLRADIKLEIGDNHIVINAHNRNGKKAIAERWITRKMKAIPNYNPTISITAPTQQPFKTGEQSYLVRAIIRNIENTDQIDFVFNGESSSDFSYNNSTREFMSYVNLRDGSNTFSIQSSNTHGNDQKSGIIIYEYQTIVPVTERPIIEVITPTTKVYTNEKQVYIEAKIYNVSDASDITFSSNGMACTEFYFDVNTGVFTSTQTLGTGYNSFIITAGNESGATNYTVEAALENEPVKYVPVITILSPTNNSKISQKLATLKVKVLHANDQQISVLLNGKQQSFKMLNNIVIAKFELRNGKNIISVVANNGETAQETIIVHYKAIQKPVITFSNLKGNVVTKKKSFTVQGEIKNVVSKNKIKVFVNNKIITQYSFNPHTGSLVFTTPLNIGKNSIQVKATNSSGYTSNYATIICNSKLKDVEVLDGK